jgi:four helix bundle protein
LTEKYNDFRDLEVYNQCKQIRKNIWNMTNLFPQYERYLLTDQIIRASRSATNCIAEGYGRYHYQENIQFCRQSRGSLFELMDHIIIAAECDYIDEDKQESTIHDIKAAIKKLNGYIKYLNNQKYK